MNYFRKIFVFLTLIHVISAGHALESYGDLFLVEEKIDLTGTIEFAIIGGASLNTAAFESYSFGIKGHYYFSPFFFSGFKLFKNSLSKSQNFSLIERELKYDGEVKSTYPETEFYGSIGIVPIKGNLNLFNQANQTFYVMIDGSVGIANTKNQGTLAALELGPVFRFDITTTFGIDVAIKQKWFNTNPKPEMSLHLQLGLSYFWF